MHPALHKIFRLTTIVHLALTASVPLPTFTAEIQPLGSQNLLLMAAVEPQPINWFKNIRQNSSAYAPRLALQLEA